MEELFKILENDLSGIRVLRTNGVIDLYCVDVIYGDFCYTDKTLKGALEKAVANMPQKKEK